MRGDERRRDRLVVAVLAVAVTSFALLQAMVIPVVPQIQDRLDTDSRSVAWVVSSYLLSAAVATPLLSRLGDARGRRDVLVAVLAALAAGSATAAVAPSLEVMVAARVVQGAGGAIVPLAVGIARDALPEGRAAGVIGGLAALGGIGASLGLVLAGPVVALLGYRALFWVPMIVTGLTAVAALVLVPASHTERRPVSWLPAPFLSVALAALVVATTNATAWGWRDARITGLYGVAALVGVLWYRLESRATSPVIDPRMLRLPVVAPCSVVAFLLGAVMFGVYAYVPQLLQAPTRTGYGFGLGALGAGLVLLPMAGAVFGGGLAASTLLSRCGPRRAVTGASAAMTVTLAALTVAHDDLLVITLVLAVYGVALGVNLAALSTIVVLAVPVEQSAVASGVGFNVRNIGGALGTAVMATTVNAGRSVDQLPSEAGYVNGFWALTVAGVLGTVVAMATLPGLDRLRRRTGRGRPLP